MRGIEAVVICSERAGRPGGSEDIRKRLPRVRIEQQKGGPPDTLHVFAEIVGHLS
jgi:hypothetical protein